jgi:hypothetical protein
LIKAGREICPLYEPMEKIMKLTALKTFRHGTDLYRRGTVIEMSEAKFKPLIDRKLVGKPPEDENKAGKAKGKG